VCIGRSYPDNRDKKGGKDMELIVTVIELFETQFEDVRSVVAEGSDVMEAVLNALKALRKKDSTKTGIRT